METETTTRPEFPNQGKAIVEHCGTFICLNYEPHRKIEYNRKEHNQHNSVFKELKNNDP